VYTRSMSLFIAHQYPEDMNEAFVMAAMNECFRQLPFDFFKLTDYVDFNEAMRAYMMK
jgi:hypothetical protein